ncbi:hypothetical protein C5B42_04990 [Candidatus Cerribacteria bacterium 'Amazon FNV 2010 28 9']|uniref:Glycosyltransferase RgtA/B/C/D-like domain-containing protein n=1 Tax=Candidatus Cerribacteria bacterium 'Amazon FNV 2010 28 9' TaxID=2081795 RepID=A0A317JMI2_9BACT|nr:MAG: hypothetical protein C5B42_04990 [Candidatus Cerribacteria bacterium 'Amazon FNV 2010 28 9']
MEMWQQHKPALLGPVTSLEGLFQGPLWYYIALIPNVIFSFRPIASVLTVIFFGLITLWVLYRYKGKLVTLLYTTSVAVVSTQQTAWTPYIIMFSSLFAFLSLEHLKKSKLTTRWWIMLCIAIATMFHFEIAYAIVFTSLFVVLIITQKLKLTVRQLIIGLFIALISCVPQAIFEVKHQFLEIKSILFFITHFSSAKNAVQSNAHGLARIGEIASYTASSAINAILPFTLPIPTFLETLLLISFLFLYWRYTKRSTRSWISLYFLSGTFLVYLILPAKPFYFISLTPLWIFMAVDLVRVLKHQQKIILTCLLVFSSVIFAFYNKAQYQHLATTTTILLSPRIAAVHAAYALTNNEPFSSYQYVPEVYDYTYQQIYLYTSKLYNRPLPIEFSYKPGESAYIPQKHVTASMAQPAFIVLIVEKDDRPQFFPVWWKQMTQGMNIVGQQQINDSITVYVMKPSMAVAIR